jgi:hypothetical protein
VSGSAGVVVVDGAIDTRLLDEIMLDEFVADEATLELRLLVDAGVAEEIDGFVGDTVVLELRFEVVESEDEVISLELDSEGLEMNEELVIDTDILEL